MSEVALIACVNVRALYELAGRVDPREPPVSSSAQGLAVMEDAYPLFLVMRPKTQLLFGIRTKRGAGTPSKQISKRNVPGVHLEPAAQLPGKGVARLPHQ